MNSNQSQDQRQSPPVQGGNTSQDPQRSDLPEGLSQKVPEDGGDDVSRNRGDSHRTPRQEQPPLGRPPQQQQGGAQGPDTHQQSLDSDSEDTDDAGDTRPNSDVDEGPAVPGRAP